MHFVKSPDITYFLQEGIVSWRINNKNNISDLSRIQVESWKSTVEFQYLEIEQLTAFNNNIFLEQTMWP